MAASQINVHVEPELGSEVRGGCAGAYVLPLHNLSAHVGWTHVSNNSQATDAATGWLDLGFSVHPQKMTSGFSQALKVLYSMGLRDGSGWLVKFHPSIYYMTSDDNVGAFTLQVEAGSVDLHFAGILDWQWTFDHLFIGPRIGYGFSGSSPIAGALAGYRF